MTSVKFRFQAVCLKKFTSLSIITSRSIHVEANSIIPFFLVVESYSMVCKYHIFSHSSVNGCLGCLHVLAIVNRLQGTQGCVHLFELQFCSKYAQEWDW